VSLIFNVLYLDGLIPPGRYTIDTWPESSHIEQYRAQLRQTGRLRWEAGQIAEPTEHPGLAVALRLGWQRGVVRAQFVFR
jgi:hypothetical protein